MNIPDCINQLVEFREQVYKSFSQRGDSLMDLFDALCSARGANSVAELSLNSLFRRGYSALYGAIKSLEELTEEETSKEWENTNSPTQRFPSSWVKAIADTMAAPVKPRGKSGGRQQGFTLDPRPRRPVVKRGRPRPKKRTKTA